MSVTLKKVNAEDYILAVLTPEERLEAAFNLAKEAFKKTTLTMKDIQQAVKTVRRKAYEKRK